MLDSELVATIGVGITTAVLLWMAGMRTVTIVVAALTAIVVHAFYPDGAAGLVTDALRPVAALTKR